MLKPTKGKTLKKGKINRKNIIMNIGMNYWINKKNIVKKIEKNI